MTKKLHLTCNVHIKVELKHTFVTIQKTHKNYKTKIIPNTPLGTCQIYIYIWSHILKKNNNNKTDNQIDFEISINKSK